MAHIVKADVAKFLNITLNPTGEALVDSIIPAVEAAAESYCNRKWGVTGPQTETFDGGSGIYFPRYTPIDSITSITIDDTALTAADYFTYTDYIRLDSLAASGYRNVTIVYSPNAPLPADVKQALIQWTAEIFKNAEDAGKVTRRASVAGSLEVDFLVQDGMPKFVEDVLNSYRLMPV